MLPAEIADDLGLPIATVAAVIGSLRRTVSASRRPTIAVPATKPISRKRTTTGNTALEVCGIVVTRHGDNDYRIDGVGHHSADKVGIHISTLTDIGDRKRVASLLQSRDAWILDGFRSARHGTQWPNISTSAKRLAISSG